VAADFVGDKYVSLTTFRKDGTPVPTPVWFAHDGDDLVIWTEARAGKVKRVRRSGAVTVASCDIRGRAQGPAVFATAAICDDDESEQVRTLIKKKYGVLGRVTMGLSALRRGKTGTVGLRITFPPTS
jgi:PPOX class probable F420-dependent enzyme